MSKRTITVNGGDPVKATNGNRRIKYDMEAIAEDLLQERKNEQHKLHSEKTKDYGVRYSRHTGRYWILSSGRWIEVGTAEVTRHLQIEEGCSSKPPFKGLPSEVDEAMHAAIKYHSADMIGSYAGYLKQGTTTLLSGETLLVPTVRKLLTAKQGDSEFIWDFLAELLPKALQVDALRSWLKMAVTSLYLGKPGDWKPKQVLALLGL